MAYPPAPTRVVDERGMITREWLNWLTALAVPGGGGAGGGITRLTGDVTATGPGVAVATIANGAVTYPKMQDVSAASRLLGRGSAAGAGDVQEITLGPGVTMVGTELRGDGAAGYWSVLTNADPSAPELVWTPDGDVVSVWIPF